MPQMEKATEKTKRTRKGVSHMAGSGHERMASWLAMREAEWERKNDQQAKICLDRLRRGLPKSRNYPQRQDKAEMEARFCTSKISKV